ncbi:MAG: hypothetical protein RL272_111 [Candidatus Parcubacteria bacterium]|jgi:hypothetical protein
MADQNNATSSDKKPTTKDDKPLQKEKVDVSVQPKKGEPGAKEYADKVRKSLEGDVKKSLEGAKEGGSKKQLDAAEKTTQDAGKKIDPQKIERVKVKVEGEVDGDKVKRETTVKPGGG